MRQISHLQEYYPTDWSGLTKKNNLAYIYQIEPQMASKMTTMLYSANRRTTFSALLRQFPVIKLETEDDFRWMLQGRSDKNIPLISASISGTAVTGASKAGLGVTHFTLTFPEAYFSKTNVIVGEKTETYKIQVVSDPIPNGNNYDYECVLLTGDETLFIPYEEIVAGKRFSKDYSLVPEELSKMGGDVNYTSPFSMKNTFSKIRIQATYPGSAKRRPVMFPWIVEKNGKKSVQKTWLEYASWELETQFQDQKDNLINYATSNKTSSNNYINKNEDGLTIKQGSGLEEQCSSGNVSYYNDTLDIDWLAQHIFDIQGNNKAYGEKKRVVMRTGRYGAWAFSRAIKDYTQLFTPLQSDQMITRAGKFGFAYNDNFLEYQSPDGTVLSVLVDGGYDDDVRNKIKHPTGRGVAKSYQYDIYDISGGADGANIQLVEPKDGGEVKAYIPGIRNPYMPDGVNTPVSNPIDGWTEHRMWTGGVRVTDPTRCVSIRPSILA